MFEFIVITNENLLKTKFEELNCDLLNLLYDYLQSDQIARVSTNCECYCIFIVEAT